MSSDILYIGTHGHVLAIDPATGHEIWRTALGGSGLLSPLGHQNIRVLEHEGKVFAGCHGHLFCLDAASGESLWRNDLSGLGHNDVTLAIGGKAVHFVSTHTHTHS